MGQRRIYAVASFLGSEGRAWGPRIDFVILNPAKVMPMGPQPENTPSPSIPGAVTDMCVDCGEMYVHIDEF